MSLLLKGVIRNGRIEVEGPIDLPEGTEVTVAAQANTEDDGPVPPEEIARVLLAMKQLLPLEIDEASAAGLDSWEQKLNQHGIDHADDGLEEVF